MSKNKNVPELRFKEFSDEWETEKLGPLFDITAGGDISQEHVSEIKTEIYQYPIYANAEKGKGFYGYSDIYRIDEGVVTIAGRGANLGIAHARDHKFYPIVRLLVLKPKQPSNIYFYEYQINNLNLFKESTGVPQLTVPQVSNYEISFPLLPEQTKIASFLTCVDDKLQTLKKKKALLEQYKKGVMQKIFSQELRFKDEKGNDFPEWEEKTLGECLHYLQPTKYLVQSTEYEDNFKTPVLTAGKTFILGYTNEEFGIYEELLPVIIFDDFTTATQFVDFSFKAKSSAMKILRANQGFDIKFLYESMQIMNYEIGGHERHWISKFSIISISVPSLREQTKIASFLTSIDEKINQTQFRIEKTESWKKGLLQKMFI